MYEAERQRMDILSHVIIVDRFECPAYSFSSCDQSRYLKQKTAKLSRSKAIPETGHRVGDIL